MTQLRHLALLFVLMSPACVGSPPAKDFVNAELTGKIDGKEWAYKHAYVDPTIETPEVDDLVFVFLSYKPKGGCPSSAEIVKDPRSLMASAPKNKKLTRLKVGTSRNLVFHSEKKKTPVATVANVGKILLTQITDKGVKGKLWGKLDNGNWVSGNFSAIFCDYQALQ